MWMSVLAFKGDATYDFKSSSHLACWHFPTHDNTPKVLWVYYRNVALYKKMSLIQSCKRELKIVNNQMTTLIAHRGKLETTPLLCQPLLLRHFHVPHIKDSAFVNDISMP